MKARSQEKTSENEALEPEKPCPEPPQTLQNRARSGPRRIKNDQKQQQTQQELQNAPTKCPRAQISAKIAPTWLWKFRFGRSRWPGWPPLRNLKQVFKACILKPVALTRLGTDSGAADFGGLGLPKGSKILEKAAMLAADCRLQDWKDWRLRI